MKQILLRESDNAELKQKEKEQKKKKKKQTPKRWLLVTFLLVILGEEYDESTFKYHSLSTGSTW